MTLAPKDLTIVNSLSQAEHYSRCYDIFCAHRATPWSFDLFSRSLEKSNSLLALHNNQVIGYIIANVVIDEIELEDIAIADLYQRHGVASMLVKRLIENAKAKRVRQILLEVAADNKSAHRLYEKFDFDYVGRRKNYYQDQDGAVQDAMLMACSLGSAT